MISMENHVKFKLDKLIDEFNWLTENNWQLDLSNSKDFTQIERNLLRMEKLEYDIDKWARRS